MIRFKVENKPIHMTVEKVAVVGEGAYEKGYAAGYEVGNTEGYTKGYTEGESAGESKGYMDGFSDGKTYGKTDISTLPNFKGAPTETKGEYYYSQIANNGIWTKTAFIPFDGKIGATYMLTAKMKCDTADNIGVGFVYEDGGTAYSNRQSGKEYFLAAVISNPTKKVTYVALTYGTGGSGYLKDWLIETMMEAD